MIDILNRHFYFFVLLFTGTYCFAFTIYLARRFHFSDTSRRYMVLLVGVMLWSVKDALGEALLPSLSSRPDTFLRMLCLIAPLYLSIPAFAFYLLISVYNAAAAPEHRFRHAGASITVLAVVLCAIYVAGLVNPRSMYRTLTVHAHHYTYQAGPGLMLFGVLVLLSGVVPVVLILAATWRKPRTESFFIASGALFTMLIALATNVLPDLAGLDALPRMGCLSASVLCAMTFYGIVRYGSVFSLQRVLEEREKYRLVADAMEALLRLADENALYRQLCDHAHKVADAAYASVVLYLEGGRMCEVRAVTLRDFGEELVLSAELPLLAGTIYEPGPNSLLQRQRSTNGTLEARSVEEFLGKDLGTPLPDPFRRIRQVLSFPVVLGSEVRGALLLMRYRREQDAEMFRVFAVQCSLVLRFASQINELERVRRLEDQLHRAQRMEAIGQLAGGIAHDFNNTLSGITGYAQLVKRKYGDSTPELKGYADAMISAARRSADLTEKLLAFARKGVVQPVGLDLHAVVRESMQILEPTFQDTMNIRTELTASPSVVMGDPAALQNVLINLAINARNAMPSGGTLTLGTRTESLERPRLVDDGYEIPPGRYLVLTVGDTGTGMDEATRRRLFEPFFTTDTSGKGSGLGLAMVYGTIKSHHGYVSVRSSPGAGSTFTVYLPLIPPTAPAPPPHRKTEQIVRGNGHVLVVDDDELIRSLSRDMLSFMGYTVTAKQSGEEAVAFLRENPEVPDVALIDIMMPGMDGYETFHQLRKIRPDLKAVFTTGYSLPRDTRYMTALGFSGFVQKPFESGKLSQVLFDIMHGRIPHGPEPGVTPRPAP